MWNVLKSEIGKPALVAAACAAVMSVMLVASPVSVEAATASDYRVAYMNYCHENKQQGLRGQCIMQGMDLYREKSRTANEKYEECLADPTKPTAKCDEEMALFWDLEIAEID
jgi:hypothetical protein